MSAEDTSPDHDDADVAVPSLTAKVIDNLAPVDERVLCADKRWYDLRVIPYRTLDHSIRGALIVLTAAEDKGKSGAKKRAKGKARG